MQTQPHQFVGRGVKVQARRAKRLTIAVPWSGGDADDSDWPRPDGAVSLKGEVVGLSALRRQVGGVILKNERDGVLGNAVEIVERNEAAEGAEIECAACLCEDRLRLAGFDLDRASAVGVYAPVGVKLVQAFAHGVGPLIETRESRGHGCHVGTFGGSDGGLPFSGIHLLEILPRVFGRRSAACQCSAKENQ